MTYRKGRTHITGGVRVDVGDGEMGLGVVGDMGGVGRRLSHESASLAGRQRIEQTYPGTSLRLRLRYVPGYWLIGVLSRTPR